MLCALLLTLAALPMGTTAQERADRRPNVLVIVIDDVAERDIDTVPTPRFDALAAQGLRFRRAYSAPTCSPGRRQLMFGRYHTADSGEPCRANPNLALAPSTGALSLPKLFEGADYQTALFGKWHLGGYPAMALGAPWELAAQAHGFELWRAGLAANIRSPCLPRGRYDNWIRVDDGSSAITAEYNTWAIRDEFLAWLPQAEAAPGPWFAMVCFQAVHGPFHTPPEFMNGGSQNPAKRPRYELMLRSLDITLGDILDALDLDNTVLLVTGDNGTPPDATSARQDPNKVKTTTYEDGIRVPMVWAGRGIASGESHSLVSFVDVLPTFAELLGRGVVAHPGGLDGQSLGKVLSDPSQPVHEYVFAGLGNRSDFALVTTRWKYREENGQPFLFDLRSDPSESINRAGAPDLAGLQAHLAERLAEHLP